MGYIEKKSDVYKPMLKVAGMNSNWFIDEISDIYRIHYLIDF